MKHITNIIKKIWIKELPNQLGRWKIDYCATILNHKIDLSNEDHCGPCGQYILDKTKTHINKNNLNIKTTY